MGEVVDDADGEAPQRLRGGQVVEHGADTGGVEFFGRKTIPAGDEARMQRGPARFARLFERGHHVEKKRVASRPGLFGPVEHGDRPGRFRQLADKSLDVERPVKAHLDQPHLFAAFDQPKHRFFHRFTARTHEYQDPFGLRMPDVFEKTIGPSGNGGKTVHGRLHMARTKVVEGVGRFARLEKGIGVLGGAADHRPVGSQSATAESMELVLV